MLLETADVNRHTGRLEWTVFQWRIPLLSQTTETARVSFLSFLRSMSGARARAAEWLRLRHVYTTYFPNVKRFGRPGYRGTGNPDDGGEGLYVSGRAAVYAREEVVAGRKLGGRRAYTGTGVHA